MTGKPATLVCIEYCRFSMLKGTIQRKRQINPDSLVNPWEGLVRFVQNPAIPMDNNIAGQTLRGPVVGRKNDYGSGSEWSMELAAWFFTVLTTLKLWKIKFCT